MLNNTNKTLSVTIDGVEALVKSTAQLEMEQKAYNKAVKELDRTNVGKQLIKGFEDMRQALQGAVLMSEELQSELDKMAKSEAKAAKEAKELAKELRDIKNSSKDTATAVKRISSAVNLSQLKEPIRDLAIEFTKVATEGFAAGEGLKETFENASNAVADAAFAFGPYGAAVGIAIKALTPLVSKVFELNAAQKQQKAITDSIKASTEEYTATLADNVAQSESLFAVLQNTNASLEDQNEARAKINETYGTQLGFQLDEKSNQEDINKARKQTLSLIVRQGAEEAKKAAFVAAVRAQIEQRMTTIAEIQTAKRTAAERKHYDTAIKMARAYIGLVTFGMTEVVRLTTGFNGVDTSGELLADANEKQKQLNASTIDYNSIWKQVNGAIDGVSGDLSTTLGNVNQYLTIGNIKIRNTKKAIEDNTAALRKQYKEAVKVADALGMNYNMPEFEDWIVTLTNNSLDGGNGNDADGGGNGDPCATKPNADPCGIKRNELLQKQLDQLKSINEAQRQAVIAAGGEVLNGPFDPSDLKAYLERLRRELAALDKAKSQSSSQQTEEEKRLKDEELRIQKELNDAKQKESDALKKKMAAESDLLDREANRDKQQQQLDAPGIGARTFLPASDRLLRSELKKQGFADNVINAITESFYEQIKKGGIAKVGANGKLLPINSPEIRQLAQILGQQQRQTGKVVVGSMYRKGFQSGASLDYNVATGQAKVDKTTKAYAQTISDRQVAEAQAEQNREAQEAAENARQAMSDYGKERLRLLEEIAKVEKELAEGADAGNNALDVMISRLNLTEEQRKLADEALKSREGFMKKLVTDSNNQVKEAYNNIVKDPAVSENLNALVNVLGGSGIEDLVNFTDPDENGYVRMVVSELDATQKALLDLPINKSLKETYDKLLQTTLKTQSEIDNEYDKSRKTAGDDFRKSVLESLFGSEDLSKQVEDMAAEIQLRTSMLEGSLDVARQEADRLREIINTSNDSEEVEQAKTTLSNMQAAILATYDELSQLEQEYLKIQGIDIISEAAKRGVEDLQSELQREKAKGIDLTVSQEKKREQLTIDFSIDTNKKSSGSDSNKKDKKGGIISKDQADDIKDVISTYDTVADSVFNSISSIRDYFIQALNDSIDALTTKMDALESESDRIASKISELEDDLVGKRSGRRDAILQALEQERLKEEEVAKAKIGLAEELAKKEKELADQERARAKEQLYMDLARAISNVALGITNALASSGLLGIIQGVAIGAAGAVQTGIIAKQIGAFAEGGFTGNGEGPRDSTGYKQAGVVHEGEWVAPKWMVNSPSFGSVIQSLESSRQRGFADGGMVSADYNGMSNAVNNNTTMQRQMNALMGAAIDMANRPTYVSVTDINNVNMKQAKRVKASRIGG